MKLTTSAIMEHHSAGDQEMLIPSSGLLTALAPGACTTCLASTCCSCSCSAAVARGAE